MVENEVEIVKGFELFFNDLYKKRNEANKKNDQELINKIQLGVAKTVPILVGNPSVIPKLGNFETVALLYGSIMEGDFFENDIVKNAVALTYYFLTKSITSLKEYNPILHYFRFNLTWEYNKAFSRLILDSEYYSPVDPFWSFVSTESYCEAYLDKMQLFDYNSEPKLVFFDRDICNIAVDLLGKYHGKNMSELVNEGCENHRNIYKYICGEIESCRMFF